MLGWRAFHPHKGILNLRKSIFRDAALTIDDGNARAVVGAGKRQGPTTTAAMVFSQGSADCPWSLVSAKQASWRHPSAKVVRPVSRWGTSSTG
ncbi:MAG: hypothetical protein AAF311_16440 [Pseudomonadota bacterium]